METRTYVEAAVRGFLGEDVIPERAASIDVQEDLLASGILNSLTLTALAVFLEERFEITVSPADFEPETFRTIASITAFVDAKRRAS